MIAYVKGKIAYIEDLTVVIDVNGLGYAVNVSASTLGRLPSQDKNKGIENDNDNNSNNSHNEVQLFTYVQVTDTGQTLHGFLSLEEYRLFVKLISISGVGAKVASGILGALSPAEIIMAILSDNATALSKAPGIGNKTAQRIVLELKDKVQRSELPLEASQGTLPTSSKEASGKQDALEALIALGYARSEAMQAVLEVAEEGMTADQIIRQSLKKLAR